MFEASDAICAICSERIKKDVLQDFHLFDFHNKFPQSLKATLCTILSLSPSTHPHPSSPKKRKKKKQRRKDHKIHTSTMYPSVHMDETAQNPVSEYHTI